ncbi:MAG: hypothetical protein CMJ83_19480 [Planctomycetes bacterium]|nr:hypothetical protein [Planctomycetota bacterium]
MGAKNWDRSVPRFLIRDRDRSYREVSRRKVKALGERHLPRVIREHESYLHGTVHDHMKLLELAVRAAR